MVGQIKVQLLCNYDGHIFDQLGSYKIILIQLL
jgi:hypothetical protein